MMTNESKEHSRAAFSLILIATLMAAALAFYLVAPPRPTVHAQQQNVQLATAVQKLTMTMTGTIVYTSGNVTANIGQTAHAVSYVFSATNGCIFWFEGSNNNTNWSVLAAGSDALYSAPTGTVEASGYYPYLRVVTNVSQRAGCNGETLTVNYAGSQVPFAGPVNSFLTAYSFSGTFTATPKQVCALGPNSCLGPGGNNIGLWELGGLNCFNPDATPVFIRINDTFLSPNLASSAASDVLDYSIPATSSFVFSGPPLQGLQGLWVAATSGYNTATAPTTPIYCNIWVDGTGPFAPLLPLG